MTEAEHVLKVEYLQNVCQEKHMRYFIHNGSVCLQADPAHYSAFSADNMLWMGQTVEQACAWMTGVFGGFAPLLVERKAFNPQVVPEVPTCS